jgi:hypothetical protein
MRAPNLSCTQLGFMFRGFSTPGSGTQAMCLCIPLLEVGFAQHAFDMTRRTVHLCIARRASRKDRPRAMTRMLGVRCLVPLPRPARLPIGATRGRRAASHTGRAPAAARTSSPATRTCPHPQQAAAEEDHSAGAWVRRGERPAVRCCAAAVRSQGAPRAGARHHSREKKTPTPAGPIISPALPMSMSTIMMLGVGETCASAGSVRAQGKPAG